MSAEPIGLIPSSRYTSSKHNLKRAFTYRHLHGVVIFHLTVSRSCGQQTIESVAAPIQLFLQSDHLTTQLFCLITGSIQISTARQRISC
nr:hypothetical protein [Verminephrobacter eiseniae]